MKTQILNVLRNLTIPVAVYGKFATNLLKIFHFQKRERTSFNVRERNGQILGKNVPFEKNVFFLYFINMAENNKIRFIKVFASRKILKNEI